MMLTVTKNKRMTAKNEKEQKKALKRVQRQTASEIKGKGKKGKSARQLA